MSAEPIPMRPRVSLAAMQRARKRIAVETDYGVVNVVYKPGLVSPELVRRANADGGVDAALTQLRTLVEAWDVMADDAATEPISVHDPLVDTFDVFMLGAIIKAIVEDMQPGEASAAGSFSG